MNAIGHQEAAERKETKHILLIRLIHNWEEQLEAFIWLSYGFHVAFIWLMQCWGEMLCKSRWV
jgi:hypothetical protein